MTMTMTTSTFTATTIVSIASILALSTISSSVRAEQPPDVVMSDGYDNTAMGTEALFSVQPVQNKLAGTENTAAGSFALSQSTSGYGNSAFGVSALTSNTTGAANVAMGGAGLSDNTTGSYNTATGSSALQNNPSGEYNTGVGYLASAYGTKGSENTALGAESLQNNTGSYNIAAGFLAGYNLTNGSYNIDIGNTGVANESDTIRIGTSGTQKKAFIAGIYDVSVSGSPVYVSSSGQLGVVVSSERFKTDVSSMQAETEKLAQLRPVTFHLKSDPRGPLQYGLIAEEVARVYPEFVVRDASGRIDGVRYDELAPMLLNEMHSERRNATARLNAQAEEIRALKQEMAELKKLELNTQAALNELRAGGPAVAQR